MHDDNGGHDWPTHDETAKARQYWSLARLMIIGGELLLAVFLALIADAILAGWWI
jgi:hypothetical protein